MADQQSRVLLHIARSNRRAVDPNDVYYLEAAGGETLVHTRDRRHLTDVRSLGEVFPFFEPHGFLRVHRNHAVNWWHIREIRKRDQGTDWELKLEPPINRVLAISRSQLEQLWIAFGEVE